MEIIKTSQEPGVQIPAPYARTIKVLLAPDRHDVAELTFSVVWIEPGGGTDYHTHDRPELIYIVSGRGVSLCDGESHEIEEDTVLWVRASEGHQLVNNSTETLKLATAFVPAFTAEANYARCLGVGQVSQKSSL